MAQAGAAPLTQNHAIDMDLAAANDATDSPAPYFIQWKNRPRSSMSPRDRREMIHTRYAHPRYAEARDWIPGPSIRRADAPPGTISVRLSRRQAAGRIQIPLASINARPPGAERIETTSQTASTAGLLALSCRRGCQIAAP